MIWNTKKDRPLSERLRLTDLDRTRLKAAADRVRPLRWRDVRKAAEGPADPVAVVRWVVKAAG